MLPDLNKENLREMLSRPLPGIKAQQKMAPEFRGEYSHSLDPEAAAVMILIFPSREQYYTLFMKRNEYPGPHSAQVSFPGGIYETDDTNLERTALRETIEETGIDKDIEVLGSLTPLYIPVSNIMVTPFVGWVDSTPIFKPELSEVQYLIQVPVSDLFNKEKRYEEKTKHHNSEIMVPYYSFNSEKIWGATAMMLSEFIEVAGQKPEPQN